MFSDKLGKHTVKKLNESVVSHITTVNHERDKMEKMMERVQANLGKAQEKQKKCSYDEKAWRRESEVGNQVLVQVTSDIQ